MSSWQQEVGGFPRTDGEPEDADRGSVFDAVYGNMREVCVRAAEAETAPKTHSTHTCTVWLNQLNLSFASLSK